MPTISTALAKVYAQTAVTDCKGLYTIHTLMESDIYCCQICGDKADVLEYEKAYMNVYKKVGTKYF